MVDLIPTDAVDDNLPTTIINPTSHDFSCTYDTMGNGTPIKYTIKSRESGTYPRRVACHIAKKLTDFIVNQNTGVITQALKEKTYNGLFI